ncbi:MAG: acyloxyacyl hydrolase [Verrucomicrobiae bacterium]|nr:acyloxyacyl hydrolase [Verrucomicrobiae bacterium]
MNVKSILLLSVFSTALVAGPAWADDAGAKMTRKKTGITAPAKRSLMNEKDWSLEIGGTGLWSDIRTDNTGYTLAGGDLTAAIAVDEVSLDNFCDGIFRGNTEFLFRGFGYKVIHGIESRFIGSNFGPRYNFVQPGWKVVPFVEGNVGFAFDDSQGVNLGTNGDRQVGMGQDFCFQFGIATGFRYDFTESWFMRCAAIYTHFSNAGLSEPGRKNRSMDAIGPEVSVGYRF